MSLRKPAALGLLATALIVTALFAARAQARSSQVFETLSTSQSEFAPGILNNGWWSSTGTHILNNDNYGVGMAQGLTVRDFFTFDASLLGGCARSARLQIPRGLESGEIGGATTGATLALHDVSTDALTLNRTTGPNLAIFVDLGTGASYGSRFFPTAPPFVSDSFVAYLNAAGVQALNAAFLAGGFFSIGGMLLGEPVNTFLFGLTPMIGPLGKRPVNLVVTTGAC
jgi:hypothetical protein